MRTSIKRALTTLLAGGLLASGLLVLPRAPGTALRNSTVGQTHATANAACSSNVPAGVTHCSALIRTNAVSPSRAFHASNASALSIGDNGAYSPSYLQSAYNVGSFSSANDGAGRIVAIVDAYNNPKVVSDLAHYRRAFGLPACPRRHVSAHATTCSIQVVNQSGARAPLPASNAGWSQETTIDVDMISAICPRCQILLVEARSSAMSDLGASVNTAVALHADVVSNSYGTAEYPSEVTDAQLYFNHPGVPIVAAAGEVGQGVEFPAASPNVVAVGGTTLVQRSNNGVRNGFETAWSKTSSECSAYEPKPVWQSNLTCANRSVADVAAVADPATGVWIYDSFGATGSLIAGGTSVAAPIISALFALAKSGNTSNADPVTHLYQSAAALSPVSQGIFSGQVGYDNATGLGTPGATPNSLPAFGASPLGSTTASSAPVLLSAVSINGAVTLNWTPPPVFSTDPAIGYNIYEGVGSSNFSPTPLNDAPLIGASFTLSGLSGTEVLYFELRAVTTTGISAPSNTLSVAPWALTANPAIVHGPPSQR